MARRKKKEEPKEEFLSPKIEEENTRVSGAYADTKASHAARRAEMDANRAAARAQNPVQNHPTLDRASAAAVEGADADIEE